MKTLPSLSLPVPQTQRLARRGVWTGIVLPLLLAAGCDQPQPAPPRQVQKKPALTAPAQRPAPGSHPSDDSLLAAVEKEMSAEDARLEKQADDILRQHPNLNAQELLNVPEVKSGLRDFLTQLSKDAELQKRVSASVAFTAEMRELHEPKENLRFSIDLTKYSEDRTRRMLVSLLSHDANRVVDFFEKETSEAAAEFALDPAAAKSNNGISVDRKPPPGANPQ